jgi:putative SOS response-associated peptidase YedK
MTITLTSELAAAALPDVMIKEWFGPRYNVAPTQPVPALRNDHPTELAWLRWDLRAAGGGAPRINARAETLDERPIFRNAFARQRCLVIADGFYEWPQVAGRRGNAPYYFQLRNEPLMLLAGIWDRIPGPDGREHLACAIVTTSANELVHPLHDRMPVILPPAQWNRWLDPREVRMDAMRDLFTPYPAVNMTARPVSSRVNNTCNDDAACIAEPQPDPQAALPGFG